MVVDIDSEVSDLILTQTSHESHSAAAIIDYYKNLMKDCIGSKQHTPKGLKKKSRAANWIADAGILIIFV